MMSVRTIPALRLTLVCPSAVPISIQRQTMTAQTHTNFSFFNESQWWVGLSSESHVGYESKDDLSKKVDQRSVLYT